MCNCTASTNWFSATLTRSIYLGYFSFKSNINLYYAGILIVTLQASLSL